MLINSVLSSVQTQLNPTKQNLSLPGLQIVHNANSGFYFQRTSKLWANQRFVHIVMLLDLTFFESKRKEIFDSHLQFRLTVENI